MIKKSLSTTHLWGPDFNFSINSLISAFSKASFRTAGGRPDDPGRFGGLKSGSSFFVCFCPSSVLSSSVLSSSGVVVLSCFFVLFFFGFFFEVFCSFSPESLEIFLLLDSGLNNFLGVGVANVPQESFREGGLVLSLDPSISSSSLISTKVWPSSVTFSSFSFKSSHFFVFFFSEPPTPGRGPGDSSLNCAISPKRSRTPASSDRKNGPIYALYVEKLKGIYIYILYILTWSYLYMCCYYTSNREKKFEEQNQNKKSY